jgi:hypothetical protein
MAWFRYPRGHVVQVIPRDGFEIASVYHLHPRTRVAAGSEHVRMREVPALTPVSAPEPVVAGAR